MGEYAVIPDSTPESTPSAEPVAKVDSEVTDGKSAPPKAEYDVLAKEAMTSYLDKALEIAKLPRNQENFNKALSKLTEKINQWIEEGDFELDLAQQLNTEADIKKALARRELEYTADNIKNLLGELLD